MKMQARARVKYLKMSPRKMRQVVELIKGKPVQEALNILNYTPKMAAHHIAKTLKSAAANAIAGVGTSKLKAEDLAISKIFVDGAPTAKRIRFQSMGRVFRIRKRYCHLTIEVEGETIQEAPKGRKKKVKAEEAAPEAKVINPKGKGKKAEGADIEEIPVETAGDAAENESAAAETMESDENEKK
jgi:large subunit ribosomal protein L22